MQQRHETENNPAPNHAAIMPTISEEYPANGDPVAFTMAGKVMTDKVT